MKAETGENIIKNIEFRDISREDIHTLAQMEQVIFSDSWSENAILESMERDYMHFYGAYKGDVLVGYLIFSHIVDELEIFRIAVECDCRGYGIAQVFIRKLQEFGREAGEARILLDVRESNLAARNLYVKTGFVEDGRRKHFYDKPQEDAILMSFAF